MRAQDAGPGLPVGDLGEKQRRAKRARLRAGEPTAEDAVPISADDKLDTLRQLRDLDERVEEAGHAPMLPDIDRRIVDACLEAWRINYAAVAALCRRHRSTVRRRVQRLLANAEPLARYGRTLLGEAKPQEWKYVWAMLRTLAGAPGPLDLDQYNKLAALYRAGAAAHEILHPPIWAAERRGEKLIISGPGPLPPVVAEDVRSGEAERVFPGPLRCRSCGRLVPVARTGRRRKWCSDRCRKRYARAK